MTESPQSSEASEPSETESPTDSWETVAPADAPAPLAGDLAAGDQPPEATAVEPGPGPVVPPEPAPAPPVPEPSPVPEPPAPPPAPEPPAPPPPPHLADGAAGASTASDRPEIAIGAAFVGGLALALILKRLAG